MFFDTDGSALDAVQLAQYKANETGKVYCLVAAPSGGIITVPEDQCRVEYLEKVEPQ